MTTTRRLLFCLGALLVALVLLWPAPPALAYVEAPHSLGQVVALSSNVLLVRVEQVDKQKNVIVYRIYQTAWEFLQFGYASALALVLFALLFGVTWAQFRLLGRRVDYA